MSLLTGSAAAWPTISSTSGTLLTASTGTFTINGSGFVPGSTVTVNGSPAASVTYQSSSQLLVTATLPDCVLGYAPVSVTNPDGTTAGNHVAVGSMYITIVGYSADGQTANPSSVDLYLGMFFYARMQGTGNPNRAWPITWSVSSGGGSINSHGVYTAPIQSGAGTTATITATASTCTAIQRSYTVNINNPSPSVTESIPTSLKAGTTTSVTLQGTGFVLGSTVLVNGSPVSTTYSWHNALSASITAPAGATSVAIAVENPDPGGSTSGTFNIPLAAEYPVAVSINEASPGAAVPLDFLGLSHEWGSESRFEGTATTGVNNLYREMIYGLQHHETYAFPIRIGGNTTDTSVEPTSTTVSAYSDFAKAASIRYSLGVNLGADNLKLATDQATAFISGMPSGSISAIEIGNEPDLYPSYGYRARPYTFPSYLSDFTTWQAGLPLGIKVLGPAWANAAMLSNLSAFEQAQSVNMTTIGQHYYPQCLCRNIVTADTLLLDSVAKSGASAVASYVPMAHSYGQKFRISEFNSVSGGTAGGVAGATDTFAQALWAIDSMFEFAKVGVDGVNWHGNRNCPFCAFSFSVQTSFGNGATGNIFMLQQAMPLYYGMLLFRWATPNGTHLLPVTASTGGRNVKVWATKDGTGTIRVLIINKEKAATGRVTFSLSYGSSAGITRLAAPNYQSTSGVTIGGRTLDGSLTGDIRGDADNEWMNAGPGHTFGISVQPTSAALLTVNP